AAAAVEAGSVPRRGASAAAQRSAAAGQAGAGAARGAGLRGLEDDLGRLPARGAAVVSAAAADVSAHFVSAGGAVPVRPVGAVAGDPGRRGPDATRLRRGWLSALLACWRRDARLLEGGARPAVRDRRVSPQAGP